MFAMNVSLQSIHLTAVNALSRIIFFSCIHKEMIVMSNYKFLLNQKEHILSTKIIGKRIFFYNLNLKQSL